jgi:hypothetical protein
MSKAKEETLEFQGFKLEKNPHFDNYFNVKDERGSVVAEVRKSYPGSKEYWFVSRESQTDIGHRKFPDRELAFHFIVSVIKAKNEELERRPLPEDVMYVFQRRAQALREKGQALHSQLMDVQFEKRELLQLAKKYGVKEAEVYVEDADVDAAIDDLLNFEVIYKENGKEHEAPFFSESALYSIVGKEDARSILGYLRRVLEKVAPTKSYNL